MQYFNEKTKFRMTMISIFLVQTTKRFTKLETSSQNLVTNAKKHCGVLYSPLFPNGSPKVRVYTFSE